MHAMNTQTNRRVAKRIVRSPSMAGLVGQRALPRTITRKLSCMNTSLDEAMDQKAHRRPSLCLSSITAHGGLIRSADACRAPALGAAGAPQHRGDRSRLLRHRGARV